MAYFFFHHDEPVLKYYKLYWGFSDVFASFPILQSKKMYFELKICELQLFTAKKSAKQPFVVVLSYRMRTHILHERFGISLAENMFFT